MNVTKPKTLDELWRWALQQSDTRANSVPPIQITRNSDPHDAGGELEADDTEVIGGLPFTLRFETYVDREEGLAPVEKALACLQSDRMMRLEHQICFAILHDGYTDPEALRAVLRCSSGVFTFAATRGLSFLHDRTRSYVERELSRIAERVERAGDAAKARDEDRKLNTCKKVRTR